MRSLLQQTGLSTDVAVENIEYCIERFTPEFGGIPSGSEDIVPVGAERPRLRDAYG